MMNAVMPGNGPSRTNCGEAPPFMDCCGFRQFHLTVMITNWNQLPAEVLGILPCKPITFKKRARKVIIELN